MVMVRWNELKRERFVDQTIPYSEESYESDVCARKIGLGNFREPLFTVDMSGRSKKDPRVHALVRANELMRSYYMTHTMDLVMVGTWVRYQLSSR
jgi:hypothetical protein